MINIVKVIFRILNVLLAVVVVVIGGSGIICELFGVQKYDEFVKSIHGSLSFQLVWYCGIIATVLLIVVYLIRKKLLGD